jgi:signal peptide peptidase SppA
MRFLHVAGRAFNTPLLLAARPGLTILESLGGYIRRRGDADVHRLHAWDDDGDGRDSARSASLPFGILEYRDKVFPEIGGIAVLPVDGTLVNRLGSVTPYCGMTGYDGLRTQLLAALGDTAVKGIALYVESPGGEVAGCFDLADMIAEARTVKPIWALVDGMACSAACMLATACTRVTASEVGLVGSIGVIVAHCDMSGALEKAGVTITLIHGGEHKADGNPYQPLPDDVRQDLQGEIDAVYGMFVDRVARCRGIEANAVRDTQARVYLAADAVRLGLADAVMSPADALAEMIDSLS